MLEGCWVYIIECQNGSYYTGYTTDLCHRYRAHLAGKCKYTRSFKPVKLAQSWFLKLPKSATLRVEAFIKAQTRENKIALIRQPELLQKLLLEKLQFNVDIIRIGDQCG